MLEKHLLYVLSPSLPPVSGDLEASAWPASPPFSTFLQDPCFVLIARFRFPDDKSAMWRSCVRPETLCPLFHLVKTAHAHEAVDAQQLGLFQGKSACSALFDFLNSAGSPGAASFLQLCLVVRENEESKHWCQRSRMPNSIIVSWR